MRYATARELPIVAIAVANGHLCRLDESIRHFKFRLPGEQRRDPKTQQLLRDLQRLHEDLVHFYGKGDPMEVSEKSMAIVLPPVDMLSAQLMGKIS
ncbi:MAG: hypothetical protein R2815_11640 [Flavobacteriales bacterium]